MLVLRDAMDKGQEVIWVVSHGDQWTEVLRQWVSVLHEV